MAQSPAGNGLGVTVVAITTSYRKMWEDSPTVVEIKDLTPTPAKVISRVVSR